VAGFRSAQVDCMLVGQGEERPVRANAGDKTDRAPDLQLEMRLQSAHATVSLWFPEGGSRDEYEELAEFYKKIKENPTKFMRLMEEF
jgi:hypothetical protein